MWSERIFDDCFQIENNSDIKFISPSQFYVNPYPLSNQNLKYMMYMEIQMKIYCFSERKHSFSRDVTCYDERTKFQYFWSKGPKGDHIMISIWQSYLSGWPNIKVWHGTAFGIPVMFSCFRHSSPLCSTKYLEFWHIKLCNLVWGNGGANAKVSR